jgi:CheY-like chemotaxis protein
MSSDETPFSDGDLDRDPTSRRPLQGLSPTVLVVDDDADIRESIAELLGEHGYTAVEIENGQEALEYLQQQPPPACVILDLWMPELDGWSLAGRLKGTPQADIPLILVTAGSSDAGYPVPTRYVLRKPVDPARLLRLVGELASPVRPPAR